MYSAVIVKIVDGDTVDVNIDLGFNIVLQNKRIRLNGVDTPESRTSDKVEKKFGLFVKEKLIEFISSAKEHKLEVIEESDKYGRVLGDIHCDGKSVCSFLLENKYAVEYHGQNKNTIKDLHLENMKLFNL